MVEECAFQFLPGGVLIHIPELFHPSVATPRSESYFNLVGDLPDTKSFSFRSDPRRASITDHLEVFGASTVSVRGTCGHVMLGC